MFSYLATDIIRLWVHLFSKGWGPRSFFCSLDNDSDDAYYCYESTDGERSDLEEKVNTQQPLYPGASITIEDSILSIMKYALRHKMSYSALSDLLSLITLHIPSESHTQHLQSLYFLKKAFTSQNECNGHEDSDLVTVLEYCPTCMALWKNDAECICRICGTQLLLSA
ncbi:hypothetical protein P5673_026560 [Acropora cervicornis]|uniref:Uncharacterized protein n=1 Tax=Acropora cervicornis TaxID=6130 RepID=A0AAD9UWF8_ACRCE|nr:hypothetical protein P5673_026560 [Acropora cervicornis]